MPARIVLCGGIGSGKSTAAVIFGRLGAIILSADEAGHRVLDPGTSTAASVIERWPSVADDGVIDRDRLGRLVFADGASLAWLESVTHPAIRASLLEAVDQAPSRDFVIEMPLLRSWFSGWTTVVVDVADAIRLERAVARSDSRTREDVLAIMSRQPSRADWLLAADLVIGNHGEMAELEAECREVWDLVQAG